MSLFGIVVSRLGRGSKPSAERPRGRNARGGRCCQTRGRPELRVRQQGMSRSQRDARKIAFSPAVSGGGHGALLGGGKGCKAHTSTPSGSRARRTASGGASISTFASPANRGVRQQRWGSTGLAWPAAYPLLQVGPRHRAMLVQEFQIVVWHGQATNNSKQGASSQ